MNEENQGSSNLHPATWLLGLTIFESLRRLKFSTLDMSASGRLIVANCHVSLSDCCQMYKEPIRH